MSGNKQHPEETLAERLKSFKERHPQAFGAPARSHKADRNNYLQALRQRRPFGGKRKLQSSQTVALTLGMGFAMATLMTVAIVTSVIFGFYINFLRRQSED